MTKNYLKEMTIFIYIHLIFEIERKGHWPIRCQMSHSALWIRLGIY